MRALLQCWVVAVILSGMFGAGRTANLEAQVRAMFEGGIPGVMLDPWTRTNNYQDSARTTLVNVAGDPIGSSTDLSGNGNHASQATAPARPLWDDGAHFDGGDDYWLTPPIDFSGTDKITVVLSLRKSSFPVASSDFVVNHNGAGSNMFGIQTSTGVAGLIDALVAGAAMQALYDTPPAPFGGVLTLEADLGADVATLRRDGVQRSTASGMGGGMFTLGPLAIGRQADGSLRFALATVLRIAVLGKKLSASDRTISERWADEPVGVL